jgi:hypothetical protein
MLIKYGNHRYRSNFDCKLFDALTSDTTIVVEEEEIELALYYDIFIRLNNKLEFTSSDDPEYLFQALTYFGVDMTPFYQYIYKKIYTNVAKDYSKMIEQFFLDHFSHFDLVDLAKNPILSTIFWQKLYDNTLPLPWTVLSQYLADDNVEPFFWQHFLEIDYQTIGDNTHLSQSFFEELIKRCQGKMPQRFWKSLSGNHRVSELFWTENNLLKKLYIPTASSNTSISLEFLQHYPNKICWKSISARTDFHNEQFFRDHSHKLDWFVCSKNPSLSEQFFRDHIDRVEWTELFKNTGVSLEFLLSLFDHFDHLYWMLFSFNPCLDEHFIRQHGDYLHHGLFSTKINISYDYFTDLLEQGKFNASQAKVQQFLEKFEKIDYQRLDSTELKLHVKDPLLPLDLVISNLSIFSAKKLATNPLISTSKINHLIKASTFYTFDKLWKKDIFTNY